MDLIEQYGMATVKDGLVKDGVYIGYSAVCGLCLTEVIQGKFTLPATHFIMPHGDLFDIYLKQAAEETAQELEQKIETLENEKPTLRDQFAMVALASEFLSKRGSSIDGASRFAYELADAMMKARKENG